MTQQVDSDQYAELEAAVNEHQARLESGHGDIMEVVEKIRASLSTLADKATDEIRYAEELRDQTRAQLDAFRGSASADEEAASELSTRVETLEDRLKERDAEIDKLRARCEELESSADSEELETLRAKYKKAKEHIERIESSLKEQGETIEAGQAAKRKVAELESTISEYVEAAKADQERNSKLQQRVEELGAAEKSAHAEIEDLQKQLAEQQSVSDAGKQVVDTLEGELKVKREELESLQGEHTSLREELKDSNRAGLESKASRKSLEEELAILRADSERTVARNVELEAAHTQLNQEMESLRERSREASESDRRNAQALEKADRELSQLRQKLTAQAALEERVAELEEELSAERKDGTKTVLAEELSKALKERDEAREQLKQVRKQGAVSSSRVPEKTADDGIVGRETPDLVEVESEPEPESIITADSPDHLFGEILFQSNLITQAQLDEALSLQENEYPNEHVGAILVKMGIVGEDTVAQALAFQHGIEFARLRDNSVKENVKGLLTRRLAEKHRCVPLRVEAGSLVLAMENPLDLIAIEDVERSSELPVRAVMATRSDLAAAIALHYGSIAD